MRAFALVTLLWLCAGAAFGQARDVYWIDTLIAQCKATKLGGRILAASSVGAAHCMFGIQRGTEKQARDEVVGQCNRNIPSPARRVTACQVVWQDGRIVGPSLYRAMTREFRVPVKIKSWDGQSKKEVAYDGFMVAGKSRQTGPDRLDNHARIVLRDGTEICRGLITPVGVGITFKFRATCLGNLVLTGRGKVTGLVKIDGYHRFSQFTATISNPPHKMEVWTP